MFISRLELSGFKSFAKKTSFEFRPGMMAVVGPNGCGKSNVVDAVRWVLGEQRSSALRADRMEQVVFNGTKERKAVGMAEVTLTIENNKQLLPVIYSEVEITRRLYRSGESEYLINRHPSRLRDIQELFSDTGLGSNAYSIIELPMIEGIITGPSTVRRALLEEAAGISGYKTRRKTADRKLTNTREHLIRIEDIYKEVEKQYSTLKKQATRAKRFQVIERAIQLRLMADLSHQRIELANEISKFEPQLAQLEHDNESIITEAERLNHKILSLEAREISANDSISRSQETLKRLDRREAEMKGEIALIEQRLTFIESQRASADGRRTKINELSSAASEQLHSTQSNVDNLQKQLDDTNLQLKGLEQESQQFSKDIDSIRKQLTDARNNETKAQRTLSAETERIKRLRGDRQRLGERMRITEHELQKARSIVDGDESKRKESQQRVKEHEAKVQKTLNNLNQLTEQLNEARTDYDQQLSNSARTAAELEAATASLNAHRSRGGSANFPPAIKQWANDNQLRSLSDRLECLPEHRTALASLLKPILDSLDVDDANTIIGFANRFKAGQQAVFRIPIKYAELSNSLIPSEKGCVSGSELITNSDELGEFLRQRLADVVFVPDRETLQKLIPWAEENIKRLVSLEGDIFEPDGMVFIGKINQDAVQIGWLAQLKDLETEKTKVQSKLNLVKEKVQLAQTALEKLKTSVNQARHDHQTAEDKLVHSQRDVKATHDDLSRQQKRVKTLNAEREKIQKGFDQFEELFNPDERFDELKKQVSTAQYQSVQIEKQIKISEQTRLEYAEKRANLATESARLGERRNALKRLVDDYTKELTGHQENLANLEASIAEESTQREQAETSKRNMIAQLELLHKQNVSVSTDYSTANADHLEIKQSLIETRQLTKDSQKLRTDLLKQHATLENQIVELRQRLREIDRRLVEDAQVQPESMTEETVDQSETELREMKLDDVSLERLKTRMQALGAVNMLALEELEVTEERYQSLSEQKKDLEDGVVLLSELIGEMDKYAHIAFQQTFDEVSKHFYEIFRILFEGGDARLLLTSDDALNADIGILATPTGKKLQGLTMLSGGEKTLTAIALLFAIYQVRPSPFCILDEVDAPLDDTNIGRFTRLVHKFAKDTQFLIITHNKNTMEAADNLYGITLSNDGTSQSISVNLEDSSEVTL